MQPETGEVAGPYFAATRVLVFAVSDTAESVDFTSRLAAARDALFAGDEHRAAAEERFGVWIDTYSSSNAMGVDDARKLGLVIEVIDFFGLDSRTRLSKEERVDLISMAAKIYAEIWSEPSVNEKVRGYLRYALVDKRLSGLYEQTMTFNPYGSAEYVAAYQAATEFNRRIDLLTWAGAMSRFTASRLMISLSPY